MAFGDSFIQAAQVNQEQTMCYVIERELNSLGSDTVFRVVNLGTSGCGPEYQRRFLEKNFDMFEADYLLLFIYVSSLLERETDVEHQLNDRSPCIFSNSVSVAIPSAGIGSEISKYS